MITLRDIAEKLVNAGLCAQDFIKYLEEHTDKNEAVKK